MTLKEARQLQAEIKAAFYHCAVPLGWGPDGYWCQTYGTRGAVTHHDRAGFRKWHADNLRRRRKIHREYEAMCRRRDTRTPIERMIDKACGLP